MQTHKRERIREKFVQQKNKNDELKQASQSWGEVQSWVINLCGSPLHATPAALTSFMQVTFPAE